MFDDRGNPAARQAWRPSGPTLQVSQPGSAQVALRGQRGGLHWDATRDMGWVPILTARVRLGRTELYMVGFI